MSEQRFISCDTVNGWSWWFRTCHRQRSWMFNRSLHTDHFILILHICQGILLEILKLEELVQLCVEIRKNLEFSPAQLSRVLSDQDWMLQCILGFFVNLVPCCKPLTSSVTVICSDMLGHIQYTGAQYHVKRNCYAVFYVIPCIVQFEVSLVSIKKNHATCSAET